MPRVRFTLPEVKQKPDTRPSSCPRCGGGDFHKHGQVENGEGIQEHRWNAEWYGTDAVGMEW